MMTMTRYLDETQMNIAWMMHVSPEKTVTKLDNGMKTQVLTESVTKMWLIDTHGFNDSSGLGGTDLLITSPSSLCKIHSTGTLLEVR
jgi:hypothetical protein